MNSACYASETIQVVEPENNILHVYRTRQSLGGKATRLTIL